MLEIEHLVTGYGGVPVLHDVSLTPKAPTKAGTAGSGQLVLQGTVKTYRYLDDEESSAAGNSAGAKK